MLKIAVGVLVILSTTLMPGWGMAACRLGKIAEFPITLVNSMPLITAKIDDQDVLFLVDSGAFFSMISAATVSQFKLPLSPLPFGFRVVGVGGSTPASIATVKTFTLAGRALHNMQFLAGGSEAGSGSAGILGQNVLRIGDVEYDLARGVIRLMDAEDCKHALLAYWVSPTQGYSVMDIEATTLLLPHTTGYAFINGTKIRVMFDTGASTSALSLKAAARAGIKPDSAGVVEAGYWRGIGRGSVKTYVAVFPSFKIGDEEIRNARLRFADLGLENTDMLIGADFFLSHRVYVASSQRKLYFTYNGGPVFNLSASAKPAAETGDTGQSAAGPDELASAAAYSRRGTASAGRRDFEHALADLDRACGLAPDNAQYFYQRGLIHNENNQSAEALADFDRALAIKPDDVQTLAARAGLHLSARDFPAAVADLNAANRSAANEADIRYSLARDYERANDPASALAQYDRWIAAHPDDQRQADALANRCWIRALLGEDLSKALADCNAALKFSSNPSATTLQVLVSRGLLRLQLGDYDKAIADEDAALKLNSKNAWALYGRGIAKSRKKKTAEGEIDKAAAVAESPRIEEEFKRHGVYP